MAVIQNKWVEKFKSKRERQEVAPAFEQDLEPSQYEFSEAQKKKKRFSIPAYTNLVKTLRGVRK